MRELAGGRSIVEIALTFQCACGQGDETHNAQDEIENHVYLPGRMG